LIAEEMAVALDLRSAGAAAIKEFSNATVVELRVTRSLLTIEEIPPMGRPSKAGFLATILFNAEIMLGSKPCTRARMVSASDSLTGPVARTSVVPFEMAELRLVASVWIPKAATKLPPELGKLVIAAFKVETWVEMDLMSAST